MATSLELAKGAYLAARQERQRAEPDLEAPTIMEASVAATLAVAEELAGVRVALGQLDVNVAVVDRGC
jgi:hypothetical protein